MEKEFNKLKNSECNNNQNLIINEKNNNLDSNTDKKTESDSMKLNDIINKPLNSTCYINQLNQKFNKIEFQNNQNNNNESLKNENNKDNYEKINILKNSNNIININEDNIKINNNNNDIKESYIKNKDVKEKEININLNNNINIKQILDKISSKYILKGIFDYIDEDVYFKLKLFIHSNSFQKKLDINIFKYQEKYFKNKGLDLIQYFSFIYNSSKVFSKCLLKDELEEDLSLLNIDINIINNYIKNNFKGLTLKKKYIQLLPIQYYNNLIQVDIYSPFFDILSENGLLELCSINIQAKLIEDFNLKEEYIFAFYILNKSNFKYSNLTCIFKNSDDINYLKEFKINLDKLKNLAFYEDNDCGIMNHDYFFNTLFSFEGLVNNLVFLNISIKINDYSDQIDPNTLENLNNFKSLKILILENLQLENIFLLKLQNLEDLRLFNCDIIFFEENIGLNLKRLKLVDCSIEKPKNPIKLPVLKELEIKYLKDQKSYNIIDYSSMTKLKYIKINIMDIIYISNSPLEDIYLFSSYNIPYDLEKKIINKIFSIKTIKNINFPIIRMNTEEISKIINENKSLKILGIYLRNKTNDCILDSIENKLPSLTQLIIDQKIQDYDSNEIKLEIIQNQNCNINKLILNYILINTKLYCKQFEYLIEIEINLNNTVNNLKNSLPIFGDKCSTIFINLKLFHFSLVKTKELSMDILENIYNNFDKMPNLKYLTLSFIIDKLNKDIYNKLINKIFTLKLYGSVNIKEKSKEEIKKDL